MIICYYYRLFLNELIFIPKKYEKYKNGKFIVLRAFFRSHVTDRLENGNSKVNKASKEYVGKKSYAIDSVYPEK